MKQKKVDRTDFVQRMQFCVDKCKNLSELSRLSGVGRTTLNDYLTGSSDPTREKLIAIAKAAGVSLAWLATGEGSPYLGNELIDRLHACIRKKSANILSNETGIPPITISSWLDGRSTPTDEQMDAIAQAAGIDPFWLKTGQEHTAETAAFRESKSSVYSELISVPVVSLSASAGTGRAVLKEDVDDHIGLSTRLLRGLGLRAGEIFVMPAIGDSMEPHIRSGELMLCSRSPDHLKGFDGTYIARLEGDILVKRIQRLPGGKIVVSSENPNYTPFEVPLNDGVDFAILGMVMMVLRRV